VTPLAVAATFSAVLSAALWAPSTGWAAPAQEARAEAPAQARPETRPQPAPSSCLVLLTLDTTRSDHLGAYGDRGARTPHLDALAAAGTRWARALTPSPLTLPAHTSLLTGLDPPEHGVRDNGTAVLGGDVPTLASLLAGEGWATAAFVSSRVLDRRFGLARGFGVYDDRMAAEHVGEYGYPERDAEAVTTAALAWLAERPRKQPFFLWVHYYDPHAPYEPPPGFGGPGAEGRYGGEIAWMDHQIGRLLASLPPPGAGGAGCLTAAVGDHGEALGEHGERGHGIFLYRASLEVPLILAGPGVAAGRVVEEAVSSRRLAPTVLELLGVAARLPGAGPVLPGAAGGGAEPPPAPKPEPVFSETRLPATAYGWSPLEALTDGRWRLIAAPRPELYDVAADPGESRNLIGERREVAARLREALVARKKAMGEREAAAPAPDAELEASLRALGYLSGASGGGARRAGALDPKDGIRLLEDFERGKRLLADGQAEEARAVFESLVRQSRGNVPFLSQLAAATLAAGDGERAVSVYRRAVELNPRLHFLHLNLANAYVRLGRLDEARREYELTLEIEPRSADAWLRLAELANRAGETAEERRLLERAVEAGTASALIFARLGQMEMAAAKPDSAAAAEAHFTEALELAPEWPTAWYLRGRLRLDRGETAGAREDLGRAAAMAPSSPEGREARRLLAAIPSTPATPPP
jgi:arylsulfatase A-like enzyme/Tfp pilus assembly protein PilF